VTFRILLDWSPKWCRNMTASFCSSVQHLPEGHVPLTHMCLDNCRSHRGELVAREQLRSVRVLFANY
jgi:hypothetical protein